MPVKKKLLGKLRPNLDVLAVNDELRLLHDRINELLVASTVENLSTDLNEGLAAADVDTAAEVAQRFNDTHVRVNDMAIALNAVLAKLRIST